MAGRKKVKLAYIINDACRKASYNKRKKGFVKKMKEISILCDVPVCGILYSQYESQPIVWPNPLEVKRLITQFRNMPEEERNKKMVNHEMFLKQRIEKEQEKLNKLKKENREKQIRMLMNQCLAGRPLTEQSCDHSNQIVCTVQRSFYFCSRVCKLSSILVSGILAYKSQSLASSTTYTILLSRKALYSMQLLL